MTIQMWTATLPKARTRLGGAVRGPQRSPQEPRPGRPRPPRRRGPGRRRRLPHHVGAAHPRAARPGLGRTPTRWPRRCTTSSPPTPRACRPRSSCCSGRTATRCPSRRWARDDDRRPGLAATEPELKVTEASGAVLTDVRAAAPPSATSPSGRAPTALPRTSAATPPGRRPRRHPLRHRHRRGRRRARARRPRRSTRSSPRCVTRRTEHDELMERRQAPQRRARGPAAPHRRRDRRAGRPVLQADAARLRGRFAAYQGDLSTWRDRVDSDEQSGVRALGAVDELARGPRRGDRPAAAPTPTRLAAELRASAPTPTRSTRGGSGLTPGRAQRADDQRPRPRRQHQRHPDRRPRRGQHLRRPARHRVPPRPAGVGRRAERVGAAVAGERPVDRGWPSTNARSAHVRGPRTSTPS